VPPRKLVVASPVEPSGASWLLNCFLELGIQVSHQPVVRNVWRSSRYPAEHMWVPDGDGMRLHPKAEVLKKWLPALERQDRFRFRADLVVEYVQEFPRPDDGAALFFVRDPRDAIYSMYLRQQPELGFEDYLRFPNPRTLLDRARHWRCFVSSWLGQEQVRAFRFEDYKRDAHGLLSEILAAAGIEAAPDRIEATVAASGFEQAREAEQRYRARHPGDQEVANRRGRVGDWRSDPTLGAAMAYIEACAGDLLAADVRRDDRRDTMPQPWEQADLASLTGFATRLDAELLRRARLPAHEARELIDRLLAEVGVHDAPLARHLQSVRQAFSDGDAYHLDRVRELLAQRRARSQAD
jgi:hypothetical protein